MDPSTKDLVDKMKEAVSASRVLTERWKMAKLKIKPDPQKVCKAK